MVFSTFFISVVIFLSICCTVQAISADNVCTFHKGTQLFSLLYLQQAKPYTIKMNSKQHIEFNFCQSFYPEVCTEQLTPQESVTSFSAYSFIVTKNTQILQNKTAVTSYACQKYSSNSYLHYYQTNYQQDDNDAKLYLNLTTQTKDENQTFTLFQIECSQESYFEIDGYLLGQKSLKIVGKSQYGCPVFQISSFWKALNQSSFIFGIILLVIGFQMLFFGLLMIQVTVFIAGYFLSFVVLGAIFTLILSPDSSLVAIYFSLLLILFLSTVIAYGITKLVGLSIFFVGAFFGFIAGALVNTIFSKMFNVYSVYSLVFFQLIFTIPFGLLTFKYRNQVIILSTSLTGSYMIIRPISWIFGGFPNEFTLYQMVESGQMKTLPITFFLYLMLIIALAILGALYQLLKLQRQNPDGTIETNIVTQNIQAPLDKLKGVVDQIIARYGSDQDQNQNDKYNKMNEIYNKQDQFKVRKSKQIITTQRKSKDRKSKQEEQYF